jgi:hypothetical protein
VHPVVTVTRTAGLAYRPLELEDGRAGPGHRDSPCLVAEEAPPARGPGRRGARARRRPTTPLRRAGPAGPVPEQLELGATVRLAAGGVPDRESASLSGPDSVLRVSQQTVAGRRWRLRRGRLPRPDAVTASTAGPVPQAGLKLNLELEVDRPGPPLSPRRAAPAAAAASQSDSENLKPEPRPDRLSLRGLPGPWQAGRRGQPGHHHSAAAVTVARRVTGIMVAAAAASESVTRHGARPGLG